MRKLPTLGRWRVSGSGSALRAVENAYVLFNIHEPYSYTHGTSREWSGQGGVVGLQAAKSFHGAFRVV